MCFSLLLVFTDLLIIYDLEKMFHTSFGDVSLRRESLIRIYYIRCIIKKANAAFGVKKGVNGDTALGHSALG